MTWKKCSEVKELYVGKQTWIYLKDKTTLVGEILLQQQVCFKMRDNQMEKGKCSLLEENSRAEKKKKS